MSAALTSESSTAELACSLPAFSECSLAVMSQKFLDGRSPCHRPSSRLRRLNARCYSREARPHAAACTCRYLPKASVASALHVVNRFYAAVNDAEKKSRRSLQRA